VRQHANIEVRCHSAMILGKEGGKGRPGQALGLIQKKKRKNRRGPNYFTEKGRLLYIKKPVRLHGGKRCHPPSYIRPKEKGGKLLWVILIRPRCSSRGKRRKRGVWRGHRECGIRGKGKEGGRGTFAPPHETQQKKES